MRSLPAQYGTIRIASVAGELRHINVSGVAKARLRWLFRNFYILDFPVLNKKQQQLIAQMWHAGPSADAVDAPELVGTVEGFSPQLYQPLVPAEKATHHDARVGLPSGLQVPAIWTAIGVLLLLGCAMLLGPKQESMPQSGVARVAATNVAAANDVSSTVTVLAGSSAESVPSVADPSAGDAEANSIPSMHSPDVSASGGSDASADASPKLKVPRPQVVVLSPEKPEVIVRVSVDREGRPKEVQFLQGDQKKMLTALAAARHWSFQPCPDVADCEHLLKFTDHGDVSTVQMID